VIIVIDLKYSASSVFTRRTWEDLRVLAILSRLDSPHMRVLVQVSYSVEAGMETRYAAKLTPSPLEGEGGDEGNYNASPSPSLSLRGEDLGISLVYP